MSDIAARIKGGELNRQRATVGMERINTPNDAFYSADTIPDCKEPPVMRGTKILIRPVPRVTKIGNIELPDTAVDNQKYQNGAGRVIDIGPLAWKDFPDPEPWCKVGDWVMYGRYAGVPLTYDGVRLIILNDEEIIALLPDWKKLQLND